MKISRSGRTRTQDSSNSSSDGKAIEIRLKYRDKHWGHLSSHPTCYPSLVKVWIHTRAHTNPFQQKFMKHPMREGFMCEPLILFQISTKPHIPQGEGVGRSTSCTNRINSWILGITVHFTIPKSQKIIVFHHRIGKINWQEHGSPHRNLRQRFYHTGFETNGSKCSTAKPKAIQSFLEQASTNFEMQRKVVNAPVTQHETQSRYVYNWQSYSISEWNNYTYSLRTLCGRWLYLLCCSVPKRINVYVLPQLLADFDLISNTHTLKSFP